MKRKVAIVTAIFVALMLVSAPAMAESQEHGLKGTKHERGLLHKMSHKKDATIEEKVIDHHEMMNEYMLMFRDLAGIVKDLNHTPTAAQKKRLSEIVDKMDEMMEGHGDMKMMH